MPFGQVALYMDYFLRGEDPKRSGPSPNLMGLYCFLNLIFCCTSASFQFVVLLICEMEIKTSPSRLDAVFKRAIGLPTIATARWSHLGELGANTGTGGTFGRLPNDPTFQEVDWHRIWKGEFGMPTTKVKKRKSK